MADRGKGDLGLAKGYDPSRWLALFQFFEKLMRKRGVYGGNYGTRDLLHSC